MKPLAVVVNNIIGTPRCDTVLVYILLKQMKFKLLLETDKQGVFLLNAVHMHSVRYRCVHRRSNE